MWDFRFLEKKKMDEKSIDLPFHFKLSYIFMEKWSGTRIHEN